MTVDEVNKAITEALDGIRAGWKLEVSVLQNEIVKLKWKLKAVERGRARSRARRPTG